jgi:hypothetical protein
LRDCYKKHSFCPKTRKRSLLNCDDARKARTAGGITGGVIGIAAYCVKAAMEIIHSCCGESIGGRRGGHPAINTGSGAIQEVKRMDASGRQVHGVTHMSGQAKKPGRSVVGPG